jgi:hypothetical protein
MCRGVTDAGLVELTGLTSLRLLNATMTHASRAGLERLRASLPELITDP